MSLKLNEPLCVCPSAAFIVQLALYLPAGFAAFNGALSRLTLRGSRPPLSAVYVFPPGPVTLIVLDRIVPVKVTLTEPMLRAGLARRGRLHLGVGERRGGGDRARRRGDGHCGEQAH
ncbi:hypothetical protein [Solirubrobacter soli]|uniref:hypothetical protein n=1 Tax=Solirubrobacter soli TaxID=363832 RepID=UPI0003F97C37|nr:hypothetical protein [Solirubrobacter soli]